MLRLISLCILVSFAIYSIFALSFFGVFGANVKGNVLDNLPNSGWPYIAARFLYSLLMIFSYPIQTFPARSSLVKLLGGYVGPSSRSRFILHFAATTAIVIVTWAITAINIELDTLVSIVGCTAGPMICYFLPAIFWLKLEESKPMNKGKIACWALIVFGILATVGPLTAIILSFTSVGAK